MSGAWSGGKGDKSRVNSYKSYWDNYDKIFRKNKVRDRQLNLFIDDVRMPNEATLWGESPPVLLVVKSKIPQWNWDIIRSYDEFVEYIEKNGIPDVVSFDHDLDESHYQNLINNKMENNIKTGYNCLEYLIKICKDSEKNLPTCFIHSANPIGREKMKELIKSV